MGMLKGTYPGHAGNARINDLWAEKKGRPYGETDIEELYANFEPMLLASLDQFTEPLPGVVETVDALRKKGLKIGSTTGYTDSMMRIVTVGSERKGL